MSRYTDTELVDALEHYAWRVDAECLSDGYRYTVRVDVFGGPVLGEGRTWREALSAALDRASESQTRAERCRPGQNDGLRAIFGRWPGDETDEEIEAALAEMERCHCGGDAEIERLKREVEEARALLRELTEHEPVLDDERLRYVEIQVDREAWEAARSAVCAHSSDRSESDDAGC